MSFTLNNQPGAVVQEVPLNTMMTLSIPASAIEEDGTLRITVYNGDINLRIPNEAAMYTATGFEVFTSGLGMIAFGVLLLLLTEKRFSATQYALFSSLFALPRVVAGPITGFTVNAVGWPAFFLITMVLGVPGLVMLARFVPLGVRDPNLENPLNHEGHEGH